jgi:hypothetical protein
MKMLPVHKQSRRRSTAATAASAFSIVEMVVVSAILALTVFWLVALQIFALRIYTLAATKTTATQGGREAMDKMRNGIRSANTALVGSYSPTNSSGFVQVANGVPQIGNALQLGFLNTNGVVTNFYIFYLDNTTTTNTLYCIFPDGRKDALAKYVTNYYVFEAEDYLGNDLSNSFAYNNNGVIHINLQFDQWEYPIGYAGTGSNSTAINAYDFYRLTSRVTRRCKQ